jgi:predicted glycoside hydrolase/deacetylase ChbG (UPF0249 family)
MTSNELLGYPRDARLLIVNIDDFGLCYTINDAAIQLLKKGAACSCTVMAPAPWGIDGIERVKENPGIKCGVHLTAISEHARYRWRPLSSPDHIPSLIDEENFFYLETRQELFTRQADVHELEYEWRAQIEFVRRRGVQVTQLDSHCNVHDSRDDFFEMTLRLALEYGLPLRIHNEQYLKKVQDLGKPTLAHPDLDSFRVPLSNKFQTYIQMLRELPEGLSEWGIHPAYESDELRAITPEWPVRASDYEFFSSDEYTAILKAEGIVLVDYSLLKPFWAS